MHRRPFCFLVVLQLFFGLATIAVATPASADSYPAFHIETQTASGDINRNGGTATLTATCPSTYTPISGGYYAFSSGRDIRRLSETTQFGSGASYQVSLVNFGAASGATTKDTVTAVVHCVWTTHFSNSALKYQSFTVGSDHFAAGSVSCDPGWYALSANVFFSQSGQTLLTSTPDLEFDGWYAKGWNDNVGSLLWVFVRCVPASDLPGLQVHQHSDAAGWGTPASSSCPQGLVPVTGGTYYEGGDGGGITVEPRPTATGWASRSESTTGGTMYTNLMCMPAETPDVDVNGYPSPQPNSTGASWTFTASDPAASGGYSMSISCRMEHATTAGTVTDYDYQPCTSPVVAGGLGEHSYRLLVRAQTSDGRVTVINAPVRIDTTPPTITIDEPINTVYDTRSFTLSAHLQGADENLSYCALDNGEDFSCASADSSFDFEDCYCYRFSPNQSLGLNDLPEGDHVLHVKAPDDRGNIGMTNYPFRIDTAGPSITQIAPTQRITIATRAVTAWSGSDPSGVSSYAVQRRRAPYNGAFGSWSSPTNTAIHTSKTFASLSRGSTYCFRSRGTDTLGNVGAWAAPARCTAIPLDDRDLAASSGWDKVPAAGYFEDTAMVASARGSSLLVTGAKVRRIAVEVQQCSTCGVVGVFVGDVLLDEIDLHADHAKRVVVSLGPEPLRTATVKLKVLSQGKPVKVGALAISRF
jgi:hypothetical protein